MKIRTNRRVLIGCIQTLTILSFLTVAVVAQETTTKKEIKGKSTVTSTQLKGTVMHVEGNDVVIKMSTGEIKHVTVSPERKFTIDGKETTVRNLTPGTTLTGTYTTTTTPVTERTTQTVSGKVWYASGPTVIITLPGGVNKKYTVKHEDNVQFMVDGRPATVFELRKGQIVSASKITEDPKTMISQNTVVTGHAPPAQVAAAPAKRAAAPARTTPKPAPARTARPAQPAPAPAPAALPKTGSPLPLIGLFGLVALTAAGGLRLLRTHRS